jgi:hypothetical protein
VFAYLFIKEEYIELKTTRFTDGDEIAENYTDFPVVITGYLSICGLQPG